MWNSIENDVVLSAACFPSMPQFLRTWKDTAGSRLSFGTIYSSRGMNPSSVSSGNAMRLEDNTMELPSHGQIPGMWERELACEDPL